MFDSFKSDKMTSAERMSAFFAGKPIDRIPCSPLLGETMTQGLGIKTSEYHHSAKLMAEVEIRCYEMFHHDGVGAGPGLNGLAEAMGTRLSFPEFGTPYVVSPTLNDVPFEALKPADPYKDGRLPLVLEALKLLINKFGGTIGVGSFVPGPLTTSIALRGTDNFLRDMIKKPDTAYKLLNLATQSALNYIDSICELGVMPSIAEPAASSSLISKKQFRGYVLPYLIKYCERIIRKMGSRPMLHICGQTEPILEDMVETGAGIISLDNQVSLKIAKNRIGNQVCLMGNVRPIETMHDGNEAEVTNESIDCLCQCHNNLRGFILSSGCQIPMGTPFKNIEAMMIAARTYGKWPIDTTNLLSRC
jgi:uroporphyrinogen decarboxylase